MGTDASSNGLVLSLGEGTEGKGVHRSEVLIPRSEQRLWTRNGSACDMHCETCLKEVDIELMEIYGKEVSNVWWRTRDAEPSGKP